MSARSVFIGILWVSAATLTCAAPSSAVAAQDAAPGKAAPPERKAVLIFPFESTARAARLDWLGEGLAELTAERLVSHGQFVFSREERLAVSEKLGVPASARLSRATMLKIAEEIDADLVVFGQYASDGKTLSVSARLLRISPPSLWPQVEESGALEELMDTHVRIIRRILAFSEPSHLLGRGRPEQPFPRLRLDAFERYSRGLLADEPARLRDLREAARLEPDWGSPAFALGQFYFVRRDCESALSWFSRLSPAHERTPESIFYTGVCHLLRDNAVRAEATFASLLERAVAHRDPAEAFLILRVDPAEVLNNLGVARLRLVRLQEAASDFGRATQLDPEEPDYWFNLGLVALRAGDPAAAVRPFREVLKRRPEDTESRSLLVAALEQCGRAAEASALRDEFIRGGRSAARAAPRLETLARADRIKTGLDTTAAVHSASRAHRAQHSQQHVRRAEEFVALGRLDDAQKEFARAATLNPLDSAPHLGLAEIYGRQRRIEDAIREMRAALASRNDAATHTALARLYLQQKKLTEAREELERALKLDPAYSEARRLLDQLDRGAAAGVSQ